MTDSLNTLSGKLSTAFAAKLAGLPAAEVVRVVLVLAVPASASSGRRLSPAERAQTLAETRAAAARLQDELRPTLDATGARFAGGGLAPLGAVVVDVPAGAVGDLAKAAQIRAILEDQPLVRPRVG